MPNGSNRKKINFALQGGGAYEAASQALGPSRANGRRGMPSRK
jgi:hypothetical protein